MLLRMLGAVLAGQPVCLLTLTLVVRITRLLVVRTTRMTAVPSGNPTCQKRLTQAVATGREHVMPWRLSVWG